ncbi:hypothetical protein P175DRAFT_0401061, partial [Aspergillus ochraceoroseus IBT 24754]
KKSVAKVQIKPLFRRVSRDDSPSASIDLSRSSFDQEGLGIYTTHDQDSVQNDLFTNFPTRRKLSDIHRRSTSGTSQLSTASSSSLSKPGSQYVHPMRLAPRTYTPPLAQSCQNSYFESDESAKGEATEEDLLAHSSQEVIEQYARTSSGATPRLSLQIQNSSFTRLPGASQTNVTSRSSFGYSRDNTSTLDTTSPTSRSSLDFVFRSKTRTSMDPVSRAATVQAARQAFQEKEAAKTRKFEQQRLKAEEKLIKRKEKQENRTSLRESDIPEKDWEQGNSKNAEKPELPRYSQSTSQPETNSESWKSQSKSTWMYFLTWLRTRIFKFRRR